VKGKIIMAVNYFAVIRMQYKLHKLTAAQVWEAVEAGRITEEQAVTICGPKPTKE
jgi:hypothetical protein